MLAGAAAIALAGLFAAERMDIDVFPDLTAPTVVVMTDAGGMAAEEVGGVYAVDSHNLSTGIGLLVITAANLAREGKSGKEIYDNCFFLVLNNKVYTIFNRVK